MESAAYHLLPDIRTLCTKNRRLLLPGFPGVGIR